MDSNDGFEDHPPDNSGYYRCILRTMYIAGLSERLTKDLKTLNIGVTYQKGRTLFLNSLCKLKPPCSQKESRMLCIALAVNHVITVTLGKPNNYSPQENTSTITI